MIGKPSIIIAYLVTVFFSLMLTAVSANQPTVPLGDKEDCMAGELAQFGRYIGNWDIHDWQFSKDTGEWAEGAGARWNFVCLGEGTAIQDFWMPNDGPLGTNLRTYNPATDTWEIAWAIKPAPGFSHIQARQDEQGNMVMHYKDPVPNPPRRITFFPPNDSGWKWTLELSNDEGKSWFEVYRISATPSR